MLEVKDLSVSYGRHRALDGVALRVDKGEICVILGANGAGKSTLLKAIAGMVRPESGSVMMNGRMISGMKAHRIVEEGIALVPEGRGIFGDLTVAENLQLGAYAARARAHEDTMLAEIYRLFPRLAERKGQVTRTMSGGEQQMVAIGRALMSRPDILMLDEPSLGLSPLLNKELFRSLAEVAKTGVGILLVEQNARQSLKISDRGYLIENGHVTGENTADALMNNPAVINAYLGGAKPEEAASGTRAVPVLQTGVDVIGRLIEEVVERAWNIQRLFIRSLRRKRNVPSAFVGRYDPNTDADELRPEKRVPVVSPEARLLSQGAGELARKAGERLAGHIALRRSSGGEVEAIASQSSLIGHNSRFAVEEPEVDPVKPAETSDRVNLPISDGIGALVAKLAKAQGEPANSPATSGAWPVSDGISALVRQLAERQKQAPPASDESEVASTREASWPVSSGIAALIARAAERQLASKAVGRKALTAYTIEAVADEDDDLIESAAEEKVVKIKKKKHKKH
jgi:branched-chain amino acid transport system ATP-binding protein